jgi:PilZ domain
MMAEPGEVKYLVLTDRAVPYLLARVRWPDVAQAITAGRPDWQDDPGLFDLPYNQGAVRVTFRQAASVAAGWDRRLNHEAADGVPSFIRRLPANWSDLSPAERHAWGIESAPRQRASARRLRRLQALQAKTAASSAATRAVAGLFSGGNGTVPTERRRHMRVRVDGQAHIRFRQMTISAGLVDLSEGGLRCVLPETPSMLAPGATLDGPFLLEAEVPRLRICLDVPGRIIWQRSIETGTHIGVVFGRLDDGETEGVQRFLAAACSRKGSR